MQSKFIPIVLWEINHFRLLHCACIFAVRKRYTDVASQHKQLGRDLAAAKRQKQSEAGDHHQAKTTVQDPSAGRQDVPLNTSSLGSSSNADSAAAAHGIPGSSSGQQLCNAYIKHLQALVDSTAPVVAEMEVQFADVAEVFGWVAEWYCEDVGGKVGQPHCLHNAIMCQCSICCSCVMEVSASGLHVLSLQGNDNRLMVNSSPQCYTAEQTLSYTQHKNTPSTHAILPLLYCCRQLISSRWRS